MVDYSRLVDRLLFRNRTESSESVKAKLANQIDSLRKNIAELNFESRAADRDRDKLEEQARQLYPDRESRQSDYVDARDRYSMLVGRTDRIKAARRYLQSRIDLLEEMDLNLRIENAVCGAGDILKLVQLPDSKFDTLLAEEQLAFQAYRAHGQQLMGQVTLPTQSQGDDMSSIASDFERRLALEHLAQANSTNKPEEPQIERSTPPKLENLE